MNSMSMSRTSSSSFRPSSNCSLPPVECSSSTMSIVMLSVWLLANILLILPLSYLVLFLGYQRLRQQHRISTASAVTSHSDIFTYHMVAMEMIAALGCLFYCAAAYNHLPEMMNYGLEIFSSAWSTKIHFHTLTCVECYLAVVHPVTYLGLKGKSGVRLRNFSIGCVWLCFLCVTSVALTSDAVNTIVYFCLVAFAVTVVCFCCVSVLRALQRSGPGESGGDRERVDQGKRRAFYTVGTILGVLLLCLGGMVMGDALEASPALRASTGCAVVTSTVWFSLPSSLVLPLLFLHRAGNLPGCKHDTESG